MTVDAAALGQDEVGSILSIYHLDLQSFSLISDAYPITYRVVANDRSYLLRITCKMKISDMIFEKHLLRFLADHGLPVPQLVRNIAQGTFIPWSVRGRYLSLFLEPIGRELAVFEVRPKHVRPVARMTAKIHQTLFGFSRKREGRVQSREQLITKMIGRLRLAKEKGRLAKKLHPDFDLLFAEQEKQKSRDRSRLPTGAIHGRCFVDSFRFVEGRLSEVIRFERAAEEQWIWDLASGVNAWCWEPSAKQMGGPAGRFDPARVRSFLRGYCSVRSLSDEERAALPDELRLSALFYALDRLVRFELRKSGNDPSYRDYRHDLERLQALKEDGAERLVEKAFES